MYFWWFPCPVTSVVIGLFWWNFENVSVVTSGKGLWCFVIIESGLWPQWLHLCGWLCGVLPKLKSALYNTRCAQYTFQNSVHCTEVYIAKCTVPWTNVTLKSKLLKEVNGMKVCEDEWRNEWINEWMTNFTSDSTRWRDRWHWGECCCCLIHLKKCMKWVDHVTCHVTSPWHPF